MKISEIVLLEVSKKQKRREQSKGKSSSYHRPEPEDDDISPGGVPYIIEYDTGWAKAYKKWALKRKGAPSAHKPEYIMSILERDMTVNPYTPKSGLEFHKINKFKDRPNAEQIYSAKVSKKYGDRVLYKVDDDRRVVTLVKVAMDHDRAYEDVSEMDELLQIILS